MSGIDAPLTTYIGAQTKMGIGREATYGRPVKAQKALDRKSGTLDIEFSDPDHQSLRNITADLESVAGTSETSGTINVTPSPEGLSQLFCMFVGEPIPSGSGGEVVSGTPGSGGGAPYYVDHTWKDGFVQVPHTLLEVKGPSIIAYPGCKAGGMTVGVDKTQNTPIEMAFQVMALNKLLYAAESDIGTDLAGYDPLPPWGPADAQVSIAGAVSNNAKTCNLDFKKNMGSRQVLNLYRGPVSHFAKMSDITGSFGMYFDTEAEMKAFFGQLDAVSKPYGASKVIRTVPLQLLLQSQLNGPAPTGYQNTLLLNLPKIRYKKVGQPVEGPDEIMQSVDFKAYFDTTLGSPFSITLRNSQGLSVIQTNGTQITTVPANGVQSLVLP